MEETQRTREQVLKVCYLTVSEDAAWALGIPVELFVQLCREYDIETPSERTRRQRQDALAGRRW